MYIRFMSWVREIIANLAKSSRDGKKELANPDVTPCRVIQLAVVGASHRVDRKIARFIPRLPEWVGIRTISTFIAVLYLALAGVGVYKYYNGGFNDYLAGILFMTTAMTIPTALFLSLRWSLPRAAHFCPIRDDQLMDLIHHR